MSKKKPLQARLHVAITRELEEALKKRADELDIDLPTFTRIALAIIARRGIDLAEAIELVNPVDLVEAASNE